jgi:hypothetical protein
MYLAIAGLALLAGCGNQGNTSSGTPVETKWKGLPYRLEFAAAAAKPNPAIVAIPVVKFTANPDSLVTRAILVMRFHGEEGADADQPAHLMIGRPIDIRGTEGSLSPDYVNEASKSVSDYLAAHCIQGKVNVSVALAMSSVSPLALEAEVDSKRLSDWLPLDVAFKKPHAKC